RRMAVPFVGHPLGQSTYPGAPRLDSRTWTVTVIFGGTHLLARGEVNRESTHPPGRILTESRSSSEDLFARYREMETEVDQARDGRGGRNERPAQVAATSLMPHQAP